MAVKTSSSLDEWIATLDDVTQEGSNYRAVCPKHGGHGFLFRKDARTDRVVFDCKAGCEYSEVAEKLRERGIQLWSDRLEFPYHDADGTELAIKIKWRKDGKKMPPYYKCRGVNGVPSNHNSKSKGTAGPDGKCSRCGRGAVRVLYRLPELLEGLKSGAEVWFCEGEKDAEAIFERKGSRNLVVTTTPNGIDDWNQDYRDILSPAVSVTIVAHNDTGLATGRNPGMAGAWRRYVALSEFVEVRVVRAAEGNDAFDHFSNGHGLDDFVEIPRDELAQFANPGTPSGSLGSSAEFGYSYPEYADRFVEVYGAQFRYITAEKLWLHYNEGRWREDQYDSAFHFAEKLCWQIYQDTPELLSDGKKSNPLRRKAEERCSPRQIDLILRAAKTRRPIVTTRNKFDCNPMLINVQNGTYDLEARVLREHRQDDMITKICPFAYDPQATGIHFDDYFTEVQPKESTREQILRDLGYSITGNYGEYAFVHVGVGGNGKTTLLKLVTRVLGNYATGASWKILSNKADESHETILAKLEGKRFCVVQMGGRSLSSEQLRTIVAEPDFEARKMQQDSRTIEATHTLHVAQNDPPPLRQLDASTRRRLIVIEWNELIDDPDDGLPSRLAVEGDYVLTRIIDAHARWSTHGVDRKATEAYFGKNASYAWLENSGELERDAENWLYMKEQLYPAFVRWCEDTGREPESENAFGRTLTGLGSQRKRDSSRENRPVMRSGFRFSQA